LPFVNLLFQYRKCGFLVRFETNKVDTLLISGPVVKKLFQISNLRLAIPTRKRILHDNDDLVVKARTDADALGQLYDLYYDRIFRFCVHRLFDKETGEDVTSTVFLEVARRIRTFAGRTKQDFRNWLYAIAVNQTNAYIRKTSRRKKLLIEATASMVAFSTNDSAKLDWPTLYAAILKLKQEHQTIVTLRFFENMEFDQIGRIVNARPATVRVTLHRILKKLRKHLQISIDGTVEKVTK